MRSSRTALAVAATALAFGVTGCAADDGSSVATKNSLVIGVKADQPGLGLKQGGTFAGFDVDVAKYVASKLGVAEKNVTFTETPSKVREQVLQEGKVDLIFATYSITADRKTKVGFGGPYYVAHQDTLVRASDAGITGVRSLKGRRLCAVTGSNSWKRVVEEKKVAATVVQTGSYSECVSKLLGNQLDAVSTDDLILAGFAAQHGSALRIVNAPFTDEKYGVGIAKQDVAGCEAVNKAITEMYQDGTAARLLTKWFGRTSLKPTTSVPQFEGCE